MCQNTKHSTEVIFNNQDFIVQPGFYLPKQANSLGYFKEKFLCVFVAIVGDSLPFDPLGN